VERSNEWVTVLLSRGAVTIPWESRQEDSAAMISSNPVRAFWAASA
jgi:hypothetical protein